MSNAPRTVLYPRPKGPCKDCADRCVNCHANCEKYISWKAETEKSRQEYVDVYKKDQAIESYTICKKNRLRKMTPMK